MYIGLNVQMSPPPPILYPCSLGSPWHQWAGVCDEGAQMQSFDQLVLGKLLADFCSFFILLQKLYKTQAKMLPRSSFSEIEMWMI